MFCHTSIGGKDVALPRITAKNDPPEAIPDFHPRVPRYMRLTGEGGFSIGASGF
jgi:hypothetical protein